MQPFVGHGGAGTSSKKTCGSQMPIFLWQKICGVGDACDVAVRQPGSGGSSFQPSRKIWLSSASWLPHNASMRFRNCSASAFTVGPHDDHVGIC